MSDTGSDSSISPDLTRILAGGVRDRLGLKPEELSYGLVIARNQLMRGATEEAFRTYVALVLCEPANGDYQAGLANCAAALGEHHLALQAASALVALQPRDPRGYFFSGRACLALGHKDEAREDLTDALTFAREARNADIALEAEKLLQLLDAPAA